VVVILIVAGAVLAIGGIAYRFYANKRRGELSYARSAAGVEMTWLWSAVWNAVPIWV
jgi:uncharacterized membrane protein YebE (DUF533 family)